jgi:hypothetical protein
MSKGRVVDKSNGRARIQPTPANTQVIDTIDIMRGPLAMGPSQMWVIANQVGFY